MRVAINGFGRIGRAITRINMERRLFDLVGINDINPDPDNVAYLLKYDSTYGRLGNDVRAEDGYLHVNGDRIRLSCECAIEDIPFDELDVDIVIDASGVKRNLAQSEALKKRGVKHLVLTNSPDTEIPYKSIVVGVNEGTLERDDFLISSSICDANAFCPVMHLLQEHFGVEHGTTTTLHPFLGYQNVLDGPSMSVSCPGNVHSAYVLGRSTTNALLPKTTTLLDASRKVLPWIDDNFMCFSYRTPTTIVSSADATIKLAETPSEEEVKALFVEYAKQQKFEILNNNFEALTSLDFSGLPYSVSIDHRWTMVNPGGFMKLVLWYDNEWGYSSRVVDLVSILSTL